MSKILTFSRVFPAYHPKAGQPTFFVGGILSGFKKHTIRAGNRFKAADTFSPCYWSGKPYRSKQQVFFEDMKVVKTYTFSKDLISDKFYLNGKPIDDGLLTEIAENDFLSLEDFKAWFHKPFTGQIICWSNDINY